MLQGTEVKSIREGGVGPERQLRARGKRGGVPGDAHISPYSHGNLQNHSPLRDRKLLLHKAEIERLMGKMAKKGFTLVPLALYFKKGKVKVEIGLGKGKKEREPPRGYKEARYYAGAVKV